MALFRRGSKFSQENYLYLEKQSALLMQDEDDDSEARDFRSFLIC